MTIILCPFVSKQQAKWGNSKEGKKALGGKKKVKEWDNATDFSNLPSRITSKIKKKGK